jgi:hypothetical protein
MNVLSPPLAPYDHTLWQVCKQTLRGAPSTELGLLPSECAVACLLQLGSYLRSLHSSQLPVHRSSCGLLAHVDVLSATQANHQLAMFCDDLVVQTLTTAGAGWTRSLQQLTTV